VPYPMSHATRREPQCASPNGFSSADPADPETLDVVGFDLPTPQLVSDLARSAL